MSFLSRRGGGFLSASYKQKAWLWFGAASVTAGEVDRYLNPISYSTSPAGSTSAFYIIPFPNGKLVATQYRCITTPAATCATAQTTNAQTIAA